MRSILGSLAIATLAITACSDDKESSSTDDSLATEAMVPAIQSIIDLAAATPDSSVDLSGCPLGDFEVLVSKAPVDLQELAAPDEQLFAYVYQAADEPSHLQCGRGNLGAYTGEVPEGDYRDELVSVLDDFVLTFEADRAHRGGTIVSFCAEIIGAGDGDFCEADWYDGNVWVGVFVAGDGRSSALAEQWLTAVLSDVAATVPQLALGLQIVG
jgi:hypothetical protein